MSAFDCVGAIYSSNEGLTNSQYCYTCKQQNKVLPCQVTFNTLRISRPLNVISLRTNIRLVMGDKVTQSKITAASKTDI